MTSMCDYKCSLRTKQQLFNMQLSEKYHSLHMIKSTLIQCTSFKLLVLNIFLIKSNHKTINLNYEGHQFIQSPIQAITRMMQKSTHLNDVFLNWFYILPLLILLLESFENLSRTPRHLQYVII